MDAKNINCCIIAIQRYEPYLQYWLDYHFNWGFSHVFLLDNNDYGDELELPEKYKSKVTLFRVNKVTDIFDPKYKYQTQLYNAVLQYIKWSNTIYASYTHCLVIDIDEYFYTKLYNNVNDFLANEMKYSVLSLSWRLFSDGGYIYKKDLPYDNPVDNYRNYIVYDKTDINQYHSVKSFLKIEKNSQIGVHIHNQWEFNLFNNKALIDRSRGMILHYRTGCVEEYMEKYKYRRTYTSPYYFNLGKTNISFFFWFSEITNEKLDAFKHFYKEYGLTISEEDQKFIDEHYKK